MVSVDAMSGRPAGFEPFDDNMGYIALSGPYYWKRLEEGGYEYGFASDERHANPNRVLHGGSLTTFLDTILGHAVVKAARRPCATIALNTQFVAGAPIGQWISGRVRMQKLTRTLAFVEGEAWAADTLLITCTAIFKVFADAR